MYCKLEYVDVIRGYIMADDNKIIHSIPRMPLKREKRVGIYSVLVQTNQLKSLAVQVSELNK